MRRRGFRLAVMRLTPEMRMARRVVARPMYDQFAASTIVHRYSCPLGSRSTTPCPFRVQSAKVWADPPLASRAGARVRSTDCSTCPAVHNFRGISEALVSRPSFLSLVMIMEASLLPAATLEPQRLWALVRWFTADPLSMLGVVSYLGLRRKTRISPWCSSWLYNSRQFPWPPRWFWLGDIVLLKEVFQCVRDDDRLGLLSGF